jgi:hypothetical protein
VIRDTPCPCASAQTSGAIEGNLLPTARGCPAEQ